MLKLADIARPGVVEQRLLRVGADSQPATAQARAILLEEMAASAREAYDAYTAWYAEHESETPLDWFAMLWRPMPP